MNILDLHQIERIYEMTASRWVSGEELHHMGGQLKIPYITTDIGAEFKEFRYHLYIKDIRTYENGRVEYYVEFIDW